MNRSHFLGLLFAGALGTFGCGKAGREQPQPAVRLLDRQLRSERVSYEAMNRARGLEVAYPDYPHEEARDAAVYVRPHEFSIDSSRNGAESLEAKVLHVNPTGSRAKVELRIAPSGQLINAELTAERFSELALKSGDTVFVSARRARVFMPNPRT